MLCPVHLSLPTQRLVLMLRSITFCSAGCVIIARFCSMAGQILKPVTAI